MSKTKKFFLITLSIFCVSLFAVVFFIEIKEHFLLKKLNIEQGEKRLKEEALYKACLNYNTVREIDENLAYVDVYSKDFEKQFDKLIFLVAQYDYCRYFQGASRASGFTFYIGEDEKRAALTHFDIYRSINGIFKSQNCNSLEVAEFSQSLRLAIPELKDVQQDKICSFLKNGGSDSEIREFCLGNEPCVIMTKNDQESFNRIDEVVSDPQARLSIKDSFNYIKALRSNDAEKCSALQAMLLRIPCQIYFIGEGIPYCDRIFNEINGLACIK